MKKMLVLLLALGSVCYAAPKKDKQPPTVEINKVRKTRLADGWIGFSFLVTATDNVSVKRLEYRAAVDGKDSGWQKYPYYNYPGYKTNIPFEVKCHTFTFKVRSVDKAGNKSAVARKNFRKL